MKIAEKLKSYIYETGRTQAYLSRKTGISPSRLNLILSGKRRLQLEEYVRICEALGLGLGAFLPDEITQKTTHKG